MSAAQMRDSAGEVLIPNPPWPASQKKPGAAGSKPTTGEPSDA